MLKVEAYQEISLNNITHFNIACTWEKKHLFMLLSAILTYLLWAIVDFIYTFDKSTILLSPLKKLKI